MATWQRHSSEGVETKLHLRRWKRRGGWNSRASVDLHICFFFNFVSFCSYFLKSHLNLTVCTPKAGITCDLCLSLSWGPTIWGPAHKQPHGVHRSRGDQAGTQGSSLQLTLQSLSTGRPSSHCTQGQSRVLISIVHRDSSMPWFPITVLEWDLLC